LKGEKKLKIKRALLAVVMAVAMLSMAACDSITDSEASETKYSVNLVLSGGTLENKLTSYVEGEGAVLPTPTWEGYNFEGWYDNSSVTGEPVTKIDASEKGNKKFYAKWSLKTYTVTLNYNGGTSETDVTNYTYRTGAELPATVVKTGHTFGGWYDNSGLTGTAVTRISETDYGDKQYWAKWQANTYKAELYLNGGTLVTESGKVTVLHTINYSYGEGYNLPVNLIRAGYAFAGWHKDANLKDDAVTAISQTSIGNLKFYAAWNETTGNVTLNTNGGTINSGNINKYQQGVITKLPTDVTRENYDFGGWYTNSDLKGDPVTQISASATGDLNFYAKWTPKTYSVTLDLNGGTSSSSTLTSYEYGTGATLPTSATRSGYLFKGWYTSATGGKKVEKISATDSGEKTFYAQWSAVTSENIKISASGGYAEGMYVEVPLVKNVTSADLYSVAYKKHSESEGSYKTIDKQLVRLNSSTNIIRADVVGISAGQYDIQVTAGGASVVASDIKVTAQDRSGYAHFNATDGVGGYKNDGTPKSGAYIIYVDEATKNSVVAPWSSKVKGLVKILADLKNAKKPVIIRIIGTIGAATWKEIKYNKSGSALTAQDVIDQTKALTTIQLSKKSYTQQELIDLKVNEYDTTKASVLKNLGGSMKYESGEFDSCWNDCSISGAKEVTVEGIGTDAGLFQWGMTWKTSNSIEIKNLTFKDYTEDACSFEGSTGATAVDDFTTQRIWLHNNTFYIGKNYWDVCGEQDKGDGDGSTDFKGVSYVTIAYNHYVKTHKTGLIGGSNSHKSANITFHHNYYEECKSRLPLARQANMHMYNNYYKGSGTSISLRANAYAFIEYCYFDGSKNIMIDIQSLDTSTKNSYGVAKLYNCQMDGGGYSYSKMPSTEIPSEENKNKANAPFIVTISQRTQEVTTSNSFCNGKNFDVDSERFYYDSGNKCSKVTNLITSLSEVKSQIPVLAGVLKAGK